MRELFEKSSLHPQKLLWVLKWLSDDFLRAVEDVGHLRAVEDVGHLRAVEDVGPYGGIYGFSFTCL
jgi:hypothetical protein